MMKKNITHFTKPHLNTSNWSKYRLRFILVLFFFALAIPTAILIKQAYSQLKWEAFHHLRLQAEELSNRIDLRYNELIKTESMRSFTDYSFFNIAENNKQQFLQRSPLSSYPVNTRFPGGIGYFQIDNYGRFTTPLLPPTTAIQPPQNMSYRMSDNEKKKRNNTQNIIYQILNDNKLINKSSLQKKDNENISSIKEKTDEIVSNSSITAQTAFDNLQNRKKQNYRDLNDEYSLKGRDRVEDLKLKKQFQKKSLTQTKKPKLKKEKTINRRIETNILPSYSSSAAATAEENKKQANKMDTRLRVSMFESEINAFEFSLLESGHFVLYRKVWRNGLRYIQGLLIDREGFINGVIGQSFYKTNVSNASNLTIAYQGDILSTLKSKPLRTSYSGKLKSNEFELASSQQLQGSLLLQNKLSAALDQVELIFSVNNLPAGPGGTVINWLAIILLLILFGGFYVLYILGLKQITLARQQQDFVSAISHELKTPLTSIRMYGEMLREGWTTENKRQQYYDYIYDESERLSRLINNVLQLARMTRNELPVELKEYTASELINTIRSKVNSQAERTKFKLSINCDDSIFEIKVLANVDYFIQIIINLVDNAIKFSSHSEVKQIDIACHIASKNKLQFSIRDYGPGINKDQMSKIFNLFYRTENELTRETVGTGIGLSLVKQLAYSMNAKIDVVNKDPGAEFKITFNSFN